MRGPGTLVTAKTGKVEGGPTITAGPPVSRQHVIRRGDTLSGVATFYQVTLRSLRGANRLHSDIVWVGQRLKIP